jgi:hypothetical protein
MVLAEKQGVALELEKEQKETCLKPAIMPAWRAPNMARNR